MFVFSFIVSSHVGSRIFNKHLKTISRVSYHPSEGMLQQGCHQPQYLWLMECKTSPRSLCSLQQKVRYEKHQVHFCVPHKHPEIERQAEGENEVLVTISL